MTTSYVDYQNRKQDSIVYHKELLKNIENFKIIRSNVFALSIPTEFSFIGKNCLFLNELTEAKKFFYKGALITAETFKIFKENRYPNLEKKENLPFTALFGTSLIDLILCDSKELINSYAQIIEDFGDTNPPFNYEITYALKYLLLNDLDKANYHAQKAHQPKYFKLPYKGFSHVVTGILSKDIDLINEGITYRINYNKKNEKDSIFYDISFEATALAKLAIIFNLQPDISSSFIHKGLIEKHEAIEYEGIDEILNALEIANKKNGSFIQKIKNWIR